MLWCGWELLAPYAAEGVTNPFSPLLFISHRIPSSSDNDPRYQKGWLDLVFIAYYVVAWSFVRQAITLYICRPIARWFGIRKEAKLDRFGEQGYAVLYFAFTSIWGIVRPILSFLPFSLSHSESRRGSCPSFQHGGTTRSTSGSVSVPINQTFGVRWG